jgi:hypothetical protein
MTLLVAMTLLVLRVAASAGMGAFIATRALLLARGDGEAIRLGRLLAAEVEARGLAVVAKRTRAGIGPLRLVRVDIDAGARLLVVPASREIAVADTVILHRLADGRTLGYLGTAVRADALLEERSILTGAGDAELHLSAISPLLLLAFNKILDDSSLVVPQVLLVRSDAHGLLLRCLCCKHSHLFLVHLIAPGIVAGAAGASA